MGNFDIRNFLANYSGISPDEITKDTHLYFDLNLNESDVRSDILPKIEEVIGYEIKEEEIPEIKTIGDLEKFLNQ